MNARVRTFNDVAKHFGVLRDQVSKWRTLGCKELKASPFDLEKIEGWLRANGMYPQAANVVPSHPNLKPTEAGSGGSCEQGAGQRAAEPDNVHLAIAPAKWQDSIRALFLTTLSLQLATIWLLPNSIDIALKRQQLINEAEAMLGLGKHKLDEAPNKRFFTPHYLQGLNHCRMEFDALYTQISSVHLRINLDDQRTLRRQMATLYGLDADALDQLASELISAKQLQDPVKVAGAEAALNDALDKEWRAFNDGWKMELIDSADRLKSYVHEPAWPHVAGALTGKEDRYRLVEPVVKRLKKWYAELEKHAKADEDAGRLVGRPDTDDIRDVYQLWEDYYRFAENVDAIAFIDGFTTSQGAMLSGPNSIQAPEIKVPDPFELFGVTFSIDTKTVWLIAAANALLLAILLRVIHAGWGELKSPTFETGWFLLAWPKNVRTTCVVGLPAIGFLWVLYLAAQFFMAIA